MPERFQELAHAPMDAIMAANAEWPRFAAEHPGAINTTIGVLIDPVANHPWRPNSVQTAQRQALEQTLRNGSFGYQTPFGHQRFLEEAGLFVMGEETYDAQDDTVLACQTSGGTGALRTARDILEGLLEPQDGAIPLVLDAGWPNHPAIFDEPFDITSYNHMDAQTGEYDHESAVEAFSAAPNGSVFLLQTCGYNDDGMDRTTEQWDDILTIASGKDAVVLLDSAYMGLANGRVPDRYPIVQSIERGLLTFITFSASKNMGLYRERLGGLFIANANTQLGNKQAAALKQLIGNTVRSSVSNLQHDVAHAGAIALASPEFGDELFYARERLNQTRALFAEIVQDIFPAVAHGRGLFTKPLPQGFTPTQQNQLNESGVFVLSNSRINLGGIHLDKIEQVGTAVLAALTSTN
jgi:aspartate/tyrosine/aromatic aminotransferase